MIKWRDLMWLIVAFVVSALASGAMAAATVAGPRTLLDLPWLVIGGAVGLAMFGGLVGTLFVVHAASEKGQPVNVPLQVMMDLGRAAVLGLLAYAVVVENGWSPEVLLGVLPLLGVAGQRVLDPAIRAVVAAVTALVDRLAGKQP